MRSIKAAILCICLGLALSGCSSGSSKNANGSESSKNYRISTDVKKDEGRWTLPTDPYLGAPASELDMLAQELLTSRCMKDKGFDDPVITDLSAPKPETLAGDGISSIFNVQLAKKYGYRFAPDPRNTAEEAIHEAGEGGLYANKSKDFLDARDKCLDKTRERLADPNEPTEEPKELDEIEPDLDSVGSPLNRLHVDYASVPALVDSGKQWRECMRPLGIAGLPDYPWQTDTMLPQALLDRWPQWTPTGKPSSEEIELATHDAKCREQSGWIHNLYEAEWDLRKKFVEAHKADLDADLKKDEEKGKRALQVIDEYEK